MKLEGSSFIHITTVTMAGSYEAVKGLVQTITNSNNFRVLAQQSQGAYNAASILPAYRACTYPYTVEHLERLAHLALTKAPDLWEEVQSVQGAHPRGVNTLPSVLIPLSTCV
jgi:hypothetical protein